MIFKSSIHLSSGLILTIIPTIMISVALMGLLFETPSTGIMIGSVIFILIGSTFFWILLDTKYTIKENELYYCSGPIRGKIDIQSIRKIKHQKGLYTESFLKPSLDYKGLYIYYNKFDDIYLSPKDHDSFVNYLLKINPKIDLI